MTPTAFDTASPAAESMPAFYVTGGTLGAEAASYVERRADRDLLGGLKSGDYCYVLNSRQMGKSSLCVRTMARLKELGCRTCFLDLTKFGGKNLSAEQWYAALLSEAGRELGLRVEMLAFWKANTELGPMQRFFGALQQVALPAAESPITVFVDEIDVTRGLPFSADEFFAGVRQCYVGRATDSELNRLTVCLLGTATPADLIQDTRTSPFNIGRRIEVKDFTAEEAAPLAQGLGANGPALLSRVLYWTGGHPYLTQRLCRAAQESGAKGTAEIDKLCSGLFLTRSAAEADDNLAFVRNRLLKSEVDLAGLLDLYGQMRRGRRVPDDEADPLCAVLKLSGVARTEGGALRVRNRIYEHVFSREWITEHTPGAELRRQREAYRRGLVRAITLSGSVIVLTVALAAWALQNASRANTKTLEASKDVQARAVAQRQAEQNAQRSTALAKKNGTLAAKNGALAASLTGALSAEHHALTAEQAQTRTALAAKADAFRQEQRADISAQRSKTLAAERQTALRGALVAKAAALHSKADALSEKAAAERNLLAANRNLYVADMNSIQQAWNNNNFRYVQALLQETQNLPERGFEWSYWNRMCHLNLMTLKGHTGGVTSAAFSPDGKRIVTTSADGTARVWDAATGHETLTLTGNTRGVNSAAFSPDGTRIVTAGFDGTARVWDAATGHSLLTLKQPSQVTSAAFSPDGKRIVTTSADGTARVWDAATRHETLTLTGNTRGVNSAAFSPDGTRIVTASYDGTARVWDAATGHEVLTLTGHTDWVYSAAFSPDGTRIVTASWDNTARVWDAQTGRETLTLTGHTGEVNFAAFSPDGKRIVTAGADNTARVWDAATGHEILTFKGHTGGVTGAGFLPGGGTRGVTSAAFSPDGKRIVTASADNTARVWDAQTKHETLTLMGHTDSVTSAAFSPDGTRIVTASEDGTARVWDAATGREVLTLTGHTGGVTSAAFSPDGTRIVTSGGSPSLDHATHVWDARTGRLLLLMFTGPYRILYAAFSPDGTRIVTACYDGTARVWDAATGREVLTFKGPYRITSAAFSPDGTRIVTAGYDGTARVWDAQNGHEVLTLTGHTREVNSAAFSPDGTRIVTASWDGTAMIWDAQTGRSLLTLTGSYRITSAAFSPDGTRIVTAGNDRTAPYKGTTEVWISAMSLTADQQRAFLAAKARQKRVLLASEAQQEQAAKAAKAEQLRAARTAKAQEEARRQRLGRMAPLALTGYNQDVVAEKEPGQSSDTADNLQKTTTATVDTLTDFYAPGLNPRFPEVGLPAGTRFASRDNPLIAFALQPASGSNVLLLSAASARSAQGTLTLAHPARFNHLAFLVTGFNGARVGAYRLEFADGHSKTDKFTAPDNFDAAAPGVALGGFGRVFRNGPAMIASSGALPDGPFENCQPDDPNLFDVPITLSGTDAQRTLVRIVFTSPDRLAPSSNPPALGIFGVSGGSTP